MEYAGYISRGIIDWSSIADDLQKNITSGLEQRKKKIDEDNKLFDDTKKKLGEYQNTQSPSYNTRAYQITSQARDYLSDQQKKLKSGEITRDQYKINVNNLYDQYDSFLNTSNSFDQYISEVNKLSKTAGAEFMAKSKANMAFMGLSDGSAQLQLDNNGNMYVSKGGNPISIKQWTNIQNLADTKIDVNTEIESFTKQLGDIITANTTATGASKTTQDPRQMQEQYNAYKSNAIAYVANRNNPSAIVSILTDNSDLGYSIYTSDADIQDAVNNEVQRQEVQNGEGVSLTEEQKTKIKNDIQSKAIMMTMSGDGSLNCVVTEQMISDAEKVAGEMFDAQVDSKVTVEAAQRYRSSRGVGGRGGDEDEITKAGWQLSMSAIDSVPIGASSKSDTSGILTQLAAKNPGLVFKKVKWKNNKTGIVVLKEETGDKGEPKTTTIRNILNSRDLAPYIYGTSDVDKALTKWDKANAIYGGGQTTGGGGAAGDALFDQK
jgi:hypothetical protein